MPGPRFTKSARRAPAFALREIVGVLLVSLVAIQCSRGERTASGNVDIDWERVRSGPYPERTEIGATAICSSCAVKFPVVVTLGDTADPELLGHRTQVARDSRGFYFASNNDADKIIVYDSSGRFLRTIGRAGRGPGEFNSVHNLAAGPGDTLYVFEPGGIGMTVISPEFEFVRRVKPSASLMAIEAVALDSGRFAVSGPTMNPASGFPMHVLTADGAFTSSFGADAPMAYREERGGDFLRWMVPGSQPGTVWAMSSTPYQLELWHVAGQRLSTQVGRMPWAPVVDTTPPPMYSEAPPRAYIITIGPDSTGLVYVYTAVADASWRPDPTITGPMTMALYNSGERSRFYDTVIDVIDPSTGRLVATERHPDSPNLATASADGTYLFSRREDELGFLRVDIRQVRFRYTP
jgi:hypothetical protein